MKTIKLVTIAGALSLFVNQAYALSVSDYKLLKKENLVSLKIHINGVGSGFDWSNTIVEKKLKEKLYCPPQKIALNAENFMSIIDMEIESGRYEEGDPVELALFLGLEKTFSCQ